MISAKLMKTMTDEYINADFTYMLPNIEKRIKESAKLGQYEASICVGNVHTTIINALEKYLIENGYKVKVNLSDRYAEETSLTISWN